MNKHDLTTLPEEHDLMTLREIEERLRCSERHLRTIRKREDFPVPVWVGKRAVRYRRAEIEGFVQSGGLRGGSK